MQSCQRFQFHQVSSARADSSGILSVDRCYACEEHGNRPITYVRLMCRSGWVCLAPKQKATRKREARGACSWRGHWNANAARPKDRKERVDRGQGGAIMRPVELSKTTSRRSTVVSATVPSLDAILCQGQHKNNCTACKIEANGTKQSLKCSEHPKTSKKAKT